MCQELRRVEGDKRRVNAYRKSRGQNFPETPVIGQFQERPDLDFVASGWELDSQRRGLRSICFDVWHSSDLFSPLGMNGMF
jgi:hypothetical protein